MTDWKNKINNSETRNVLKDPLNLASALKMNISKLDPYSAMLEQQRFNQAITAGNSNFSSMKDDNDRIAQGIMSDFKIDKVRTITNQIMENPQIRTMNQAMNAHSLSFYLQQTDKVKSNIAGKFRAVEEPTFEHEIEYTNNSLLNNENENLLQLVGADRLAVGPEIGIGENPKYFADQGWDATMPN